MAQQDTSQVNKAITQIYTMLAPAFNQGDQSINDMMFGEFVIRNIEPHMHEALEIGCGVGRLALRVGQHIPHVIGIDITPAMIDYARSRPQKGNVEFVVGDAQTYPFNQKFDFIYGVLVLDSCDRRMILPRLRDLLNPGGVLLIIDRFFFDENPSMAAGFMSYLGWRRRHGLGLNLMPIIRNMKRITLLFSHPAWKDLDEVCKQYRITQPEYEAMLKEILPSATFEMVEKATAIIKYTAKG